MNRNDPSAIPASALTPTPTERRVLGVDPGLNVVGYAVLEGDDSGPVVVEAGVIRTGGSRQSLPDRLVTIHRGILELIEEFHPEALALEQIHSHPNHPRTSILMAHARGVIVLAASLNHLAIQGYAPTTIKKVLTGSGRAPKEQMQQAIRTELGLTRLPEPHDVADACAIALCHYQRLRA